MSHAMESVLVTVPHSASYKTGHLSFGTPELCVGHPQLISPFTEYIRWLIKQLLAGEGRRLVFTSYVRRSPLQC